MNESAAFKSGFIALVGRPNVGKSTLVNRLVGRKLAIISDKPQTTRNKITAVLTTDEAQLIFFDTPGIHKPKHKLGEYMVQTAERALQEVDVILFLVEAQEREIGPGNRFVMDQLKQVKTPVILVVNKIDTVKKEELLPVIAMYSTEMAFAGVVPVSGLAGDNVEELVKIMTGMLPAGPKYYPDDMVTDQPERAIIKEMVREKVLHLTRDEIPHSVAVEIEEIRPRGQDMVYVRAVIYVERDSQKGIIVGKKGLMLKEIGGLARTDIENLLGSKIFLDLWVKVKKDWRNRDSVLRDLGYDLRE